MGLLLCLCCGGASAAEVQGKVVLSTAFVEALEKSQESTDNSLDFYWSEPNGILSVQPPSVDFASQMAVVLIPPSSTTAPADEAITLRLADSKLEKEALVVHKGTIVRFRNEEPFVHELYSPQIADFKPEMQSTNGVRQLSFDTPGIFEIRCKRMPHLIGFVAVVATPFVSKLNDQGEFSFSNVSPGEYTLQVFYRGQWIQELKINVEEKKSGPITVELKSPKGPEVPPAAPQEKKGG